MFPDIHFSKATEHVASELFFCIPNVGSVASWYNIHIVTAVAFATRREFVAIAERVKRSPLFAGIDESRLKSLLACLKAVKRQYHKNGFVFVTGGKATSAGIVLSGVARVLQEDFWRQRLK